MEWKYCWRCKEIVPFLNKKEFDEISFLYSECVHSVKKYRKEHGVLHDQSPIEELFKPVRIRYEEITGWKNMHHNAIMHHTLSLLGEDCPQCGKPLRSTRAKLCPECGWKRGIA